MNKLLFLTNDLNLSGGQELANRYFLEMLKKKFNIYIVNQQFFEETNNYKKIKIDFNVDFRKGFIKNFFYLIKILRKLDRKDFKVIFISANPFSTLLFAFIIFSFRLFRKTKKIIFSHTDPYYSLFYASRITYILLVLGKIFYKKFNFIIASNTYMKNSFINYYKIKEENIKILPLPIRKEFFNLLKEDFSFALLKINPKRPIFLSVGRLVKQKDPFTLLKAFSIFIKKNKKGTLIFVGDGEEKERLIELSKKLKIAKNVYFLGFLKNPISLMKKADVFLFSSKYEGTGIVLIEAQAVGLPIIATDCPVGPRWVLDNGKAGILVPVGDEKKMAYAMIKLLRNKVLGNKLVKNGLYLAKRFNYNRVEKQCLDFLTNL